MDNPKLLIEEMRSPENLIYINENETYMIWFKGNNTKIEDENISCIFGFSRYVGPRYIEATVMLDIKESYESMFAFNISGYPENYSEAPVENLRNMVDSELVKCFISGIVGSAMKNKKHLEIHITNLIFHDIYSSMNSFRELGELFGRNINLVEKICF